MMNLRDIICCPRCRSALIENVQADDEKDADAMLYCANKDCRYASTGFISICGQPVLIDFEESIFVREEILSSGDAHVLPSEGRRRKLRTIIRTIGEFFFGQNTTAKHFSERMAQELKKNNKHPRLLIIGGGIVGSGIKDIYSDKDIQLIGADVYLSEYTKIIADCHRLPFINASFDGVWIQAVLEHVLNPCEVVAEIHRILTPHGIVYADTPFMQQVHMGAYDFTRFSVSGHRWLFRNFKLLSAGAVGGAGTATRWSIGYLVRSLTGNDKIATAISLLFFWLRFIDGVAKTRPNADAASGVYFYGTKTLSPIGPKEMVEFYASQET
jgi:SAM-dependent methyltransferase